MREAVQSRKCRHGQAGIAACGTCGTTSWCPNCGAIKLPGERKWCAPSPSFSLDELETGAKGKPRGKR